MKRSAIVAWASVIYFTMGKSSGFSWPSYLVGFCSQVEHCPYSETTVQRVFGYMKQLTRVDVVTKQNQYGLIKRKNGLALLKTCKKRRDRVEHEGRVSNGANFDRIKYSKIDRYKRTDEFFTPLKFNKTIMDHCTLVSMDSGMTYPDMLYILTKCKKNSKYNQRILLLNTTSKKLLKPIKIPKMRTKVTQIIIGECPGTTKKCLYCFCSGFLLRIHLFTEESFYKHDWSLVSSYDPRSIGGNKCICSFFEPTELLCIVDDKHMKRIRLHYKSNFITVYDLKWELKGYNEIRSFQIENYHFTGMYAAIADTSSLKLVILDISNKKIRNRCYLPLNSSTAILKMRSVTWFEGSLGNTFFRCSIDTDCDKDGQSFCCKNTPD